MTLRSARERMPTDAWGIVDGYEDTPGGWHATPAETCRAILAAALRRPPVRQDTHAG